MFKTSLTFAVVALLAATMMACSPAVRSVGSALEPVPITHRTNGDSTSSEIELNATGFYGHTADKDNLKDNNLFGGAASATFRFGGVLSPLFFSTSFGAFTGSTRFGCDEDGNVCGDTKSENSVSEYLAKNYKEWLTTPDGKKKYGFNNFQERLLLGLDFNPGSFIFLGFAGGAQFYQGNGSYERKKKELDSKSIVVDVDGDNNFAMVTAYWFGSRFGRNGKLGMISLEWDILHKGVIDDWNTSFKMTYTHPTGFYFGYASGGVIDYTVYIGKTFKLW